jgi:hypothetical protein
MGGEAISRVSGYYYGRKHSFHAPALVIVIAIRRRLNLSGA